MGNVSQHSDFLNSILQFMTGQMIMYQFGQVSLNFLGLLCPKMLDFGADFFSVFTMPFFLD